MAENKPETTGKENRGWLIGVGIVIVLLVIGVVSIRIWKGNSNDDVAVLPTATEGEVEATATITPESAETEEPEAATATATEEPMEEPTEQPTEEPTEAPTEEPTKEPPELLPPEPQEISFHAEDGQVLEGRYYPGNTPNSALLVLMHWAPGNMDDWNEIAFWLQNRGLGGSSANLGSAPWLDPSWFPALPEGKSYAVFTFNFRNGSRDGMLLDAQAAFETGRTLEGVDPNRIASFGASIGADGAPDGCSWHNDQFGGGCPGALSLSPGSYLTISYAEVVNRLGTEQPPKPVWCLFASGDTESAETCQSVEGNHYRMVEWTDGDWHGMNLIDPSRDPNALQLIIDWLLLLGL